MIQVNIKMPSRCYDCHLIEQESVLEKIKAGIEEKCCVTVGQENDPAITLYDVFHIIDKYKTKNEV